MLQARAPYVHELTLRVTDGWELLAGVTLERLLRACSGTQPSTYTTWEGVHLLFNP